MPRPHFSRSEFALLLLPVAGLCYLAARSSHTGARILSPRAPFTFKTVTLSRGRVTPLDVSGGADTRIDFFTQAVGLQDNPAASNWEWVDDAYIVAIKNGHTRRIAGLFDKRQPSARPIFINEYMGDRSSAWPSPGLDRYWLLHLADVPRNIGELELRCDFGYGPRQTAYSNAPGARLKLLQANRLAASSSVHLTLRPDGVPISPVKVSTDPLYNVRKVTLTHNKPGNPEGQLHIEVQLFYRGPLKPGRKGAMIDQDWKLDGAYGTIEEKGWWSHLQPSTGGGRRYTVSEDMDMPDFGPGYDSDKPLKLHGSISVEKAWPRSFSFSFPLPKARP